MEAARRTPGLGRLAAFSDLSPEDLASLKTLLGATREVRRGEVLISEGDATPRLYLLRKGWAASSVTSASGARQMIKVHMGGDVLGMPNLAVASAVATVTTLSAGAVSVISPTALGRIFRENARLSAILFLVSQEERVGLIDRLVSIGGSAGASRIATTLLQLHARARAHDPGLGDTFELPLTQRDIGELSGLAYVQTNRSMQSLRKDRLIKWDRQKLTILDGAALRRLSGTPERTHVWRPGWLPQRHD